MLVGSETSQNELHAESAVHHDNPEYQHIQALRELQNIDLDFFRSVQQIEPEEMDQGATLQDALKVGVDMLAKFCKKNKIKRRLFLITDGERQCSDDKDAMATLVAEIGEHDVKINCITVDFCNNVDDEEAEPDENESAAQKANREFLLEI